MGSALRGTGIVKPAMAMQALTVLLNALLAPMLIAGWGTGIRDRRRGRGAREHDVDRRSACVLLGLYFMQAREVRVVSIATCWQPQLAVWKRMLDVGLPAGGEFALMFIYMGVIYWVISAFRRGGAGRIRHRLARSCSRSSCPRWRSRSRRGRSRARTSARAAARACARRSAKAVMLNTVVMVAVTVFLQWRPEVARRASSRTRATRPRSARRSCATISWTFIAQGVVFTCSGMFQGLGNTRPAMLSSAVRLAVFVPLAVWLSTQPGFHLEQLWLVSVMTVWIQAGVSYMLLRQQFKRRLTDVPHSPLAGVPATAESRG